MSEYFNDLEYYSSIHNCYTYGDLIGIQEEDGYIMKNKKDGREEICDSDYIRKITNISTESQENGICEFIRGEDEFLEVKIKEKKGLFYIIESTDEEGNSSTRLARQKDLRNINYIPFEELIKDKYENNYVDVPSELSLWINSEKFNEVIEQIKEHTLKDSENSELFIVSYRNEDISQLRIFSNSDKNEFIKIFLEEAIKKEKKLINIDNNKEDKKEIIINNQDKKDDTNDKKGYIITPGFDSINEEDEKEIKIENKKDDNNDKKGYRNTPGYEINCKEDEKEIKIEKKNEDKNDNDKGLINTRGGDDIIIKNDSMKKSSISNIRPEKKSLIGSKNIKFKNPFASKKQQKEYINTPLPDQQDKEMKIIKNPFAKNNEEKEEPKEEKKFDNQLKNN